jgi:hypothetical protein
VRRYSSRRLHDLMREDGPRSLVKKRAALTRARAGSRGVRVVRDAAFGAGAVLRKLVRVSEVVRVRELVRGTRARAGYASSCGVREFVRGTRARAGMELERCR